MKSKSSCKTKLNVPSSYFDELKKYPKSQRAEPWTKEMDEFVLAAKKKGYTYEIIANILGKSKSPVRDRYFKLLNHTLINTF